MRRRHYIYAIKFSAVRRAATPRRRLSRAANKRLGKESRPTTSQTDMELALILCISLFSICVNGNCSILEEMFIFERLMKPCGDELYHDDFDSDKRLGEILQLSHGILSDVKNLHVLMNSPKCDGLTLDTLPPLPNITGDKAGDSIYSALLYQVAHVFSIVTEHDVFPLVCSNHSEQLALGFRKLGGKLLLLQCFINSDVLPPTVDEKQKTRFRFRDECSARQTRDCVVLERTLDLLNLLMPTSSSSTDFIKQISINSTN